MGLDFGDPFDDDWRWVMTMDCIEGTPTVQRITLQSQNLNHAISLVVYAADFSLPHDCLQPFTLPRTSMNARCTGFPANVTITPV